MPYIEIDNIKSHYTCQGQGKPVILLHGWGQNTEMMKHISDFLAKHFKVYNFDFPGFGLSSLPHKAYSCHDYYLWLKEALKVLKIENPIIIAHSFGARIAFHYASKHLVHKMCLTGAAGIKPELSLTSKMKIKAYKTMKKILVLLNQKKLLNKLSNYFGSSDYRNSHGVMRQTLVKVVNDDCSAMLKDIKCETLLVFGDQDYVTPLESARKMEKLLPNATLVVFEGDDHFAYFNQARRFNLVLDAFLKEDYE